MGAPASGNSELTLHMSCWTFQQSSHRSSPTGICQRDIKGKVQIQCSQMFGTHCTWADVLEPIVDTYRVFGVPGEGREE
jgi:hypothetical protein